MDPILWLPLSKSERSRCIRWRLGWLPSGKPRPCPKHPMQQLSKNHAINCLDMHRRLFMPKTAQDPLSFLLNMLPLRPSIPPSSALICPMHHIPRNVWYKLLHKKLSTRANLHRIIPAKVDDDYCQLCKLPETEQHMLLTCIQKQDLWNAAFKKYLSNPKDPNCSSIFEDLSTLRLSKYYILHYHDKFTIYDFFATVIRFIWKAHWQQFFEQTPVVDEIVLNQIQKELLKPSAYNSLY
ncbi:hypothetical protein G6F46_012598 [Rhizopus delemar]|uniref:Reverse transcriptase zinc-binding domain-containing protein n=2 Tax=Rhizopus TaxID=4842 RepID=A0A9P6YR59_9FUNG|nr:hypothetical protein G6F49_012706 [Rhizopus delemar]KAG1557159.1 hypothetical protein G6F50_012634 [Rhizopus delemar]KAG1577435.1 hypothetical protein G6F48_012678 [Rhizopus delemar]KAG1580110.1 hypothetical protein G6F47_012702 [Rhizopus delemar]KAG1607018.1 hypothetical protein G6F46_012598 [Rhizopus delemar]